MRHSLAQLLAASSGGASPSGASWPLSGAGSAPRGRDGGDGDASPARAKPQQPRREEAAAEAGVGPPEAWEQEDWFPGLELGDLLEAARPELSAEATPRLKKKKQKEKQQKRRQYVLGLENRLQGLAAENRQLRDRNRGLSRRLRELRRESAYLRAVLANQSALGRLLGRLAGLFPEAGGDSGDHDYALPSTRPRGPQEEEWAAPGGICLHVERDQVSVELCSVCARRAAASFKIFSFRCLPCQAPLCRG
ncbi:CREB/ATF bZIP transcription factor [Cuculus canorus]|uniref:CREB/ATF bZIP transcription factor n=1 Tax=Cuculus canorus TaxID=55661 RepID=UPI0023AA391E|nr:CREB/ATF bZIP transcription factor [Cuculus canorus]XP_053912035.1 CREB/ATF bZIP transcription factor [Cuculus canorus]